jgi:dolichyl-phosphate-mannose-protein mannosyltransferase
MISSGWDAVARRASAIAGLAAVAAITAGAIWGTYIAGGPDSYCYLNQAELFVQGRVRDPQPIVAAAPWPDRVNTAVPVGHVAAPDGDIATVPMCPPGYPLALAAARLAGGRTAMFWVVPLFGGLGVWCTFLLGRRLGGPQAGAMASLVFAASPAFLYQIVQPMSDVPAAAVWTAALVAALRPPGTGQALLTGALTGAALLIRPNLAPLGMVMASLVIAAPRAAHSPSRATGRADVIHSTLLFGLGALPFLAVILVMQNAMYGSPFTSGYGSLGLLFTADHIAPNLARYPVWLVTTHTPFVVLALAAPFALADRTARMRAWWLLSFALVTFACYVAYTVYDAWWFLRFLLPAIPPLIVLASAVTIAWLGRLSPRIRTAALAVLTVALVAFQIVTAADRAVFRLRDLERRFRDGGDYVARKLPPNAVIFTTQQSGSIRFYAGRPTIIWDMLDPAWLDRAVDDLRARGYHVFFLFEKQEDLTFRQRFEANSKIGGLEWPPMAQIGQDVRIFDPLDYERFRRGEKVDTDYVFNKR